MTHVDYQEVGAICVVILALGYLIYFITFDE
jgi:hypothetical protein